MPMPWFIHKIEDYTSMDFMTTAHKEAGTGTSGEFFPSIATNSFNSEITRLIDL